jgi:hypothetical protein
VSEDIQSKIEYHHHYELILRVKASENYPSMSDESQHVCHIHNSIRYLMISNITIGHTCEVRNSVLNIVEKICMNDRATKRNNLFFYRYVWHIEYGRADRV